MSGLAPCCLVLLRHGQNEWNTANRFTGWMNVSLTARGEREAARAGQLLAGHGLLPVAVHTSLQRRTIHTADLALAAALQPRYIAYLEEHGFPPEGRTGSCGGLSRP